MELEDATFKVYTNSVFDSTDPLSAELRMLLFARNGFVSFLGVVDDGSDRIFRAFSFFDRVVRDLKRQRVYY
jgi:hypothetical protein